MERLQETLKILRKARERSGAIAVAFSGGKDSLIVLDMCLRTFERVEAYFMYFLPGLQCVEDELEKARKRWGISIHQYPHWILSKAIYEGAHRPPSHRFDDVPVLKLRDVQNMVMADLGINLIATGARRADSLWRRRNLKALEKQDDVIYPIVGWSKADVHAYLGNRQIPLPSSSGRNATGVGLSTPSVLWLHDNFPDDFRRLCEVFPYAEAIVWRRAWYGVA